MVHRNTHNRTAASTASRPGISIPLTQKHIKHYKTNAFLMISNFFYSTAQVGITFFPNRSLLLRVLILVQRGGYTETHTKRDLEKSPRARRRISQLQNSSRILSKVKNYTGFLVSENFATVKIRVWRFFLYFSHF